MGMRSHNKRQSTSPLQSVITSFGTVSMFFAVCLFIVLLAGLFLDGATPALILAFGLPAIAMLLLGMIIRFIFAPPQLHQKEALLLTVFSWSFLTLVGAFPIWILVDRITYLDAVFEATAGLTTTGITVLQNLQSLPRSILLWRSTMQFLGGLGILSFFLAVAFRRGEAPFHLFVAETSKMDAPRLTPNLYRSVNLIVFIYITLTIVFAALYMLSGMNAFDAVNHAMTSISTGGFSTYDANIAHFRHTDVNFSMLQWSMTFAMLVGGISFLIHFRILQGELRSLWDSSEMRTFWVILLLSLALIVLGNSLDKSTSITSYSLGISFFQTVSLLTSAGYTIEPISSQVFPHIAKIIFLLLMLTGGMAGSTSGGVKVLRVVILFRAAKLEIRRLYTPRQTVHPLVVDQKIVPSKEFARVSALLMLWMIFSLAGTALTLLLTEYNFLGSFSGALSTVSNMGPVYLSADEVATLPAPVKVSYILAMISGRLEIIPIALFVSLRSWQ